MNTTKASEIEQMYNRQKPYFESLFNLTDDEIKVKVDKLMPSKLYSRCWDNADVVKVFKNSEPKEVRLEFYDSLVINWLGIFLRYESGKEEMVLEFSKHLDMIESEEQVK
jgi:hypothetical protein